MPNVQKLKNIVSYFVPLSENIEIKPLGAGHINDSFRVTNGNNEYVLQRINHSIFKDVPALQSNILRVTMHIRQKLIERGETDIDRKVLTLVPTLEGKLYFEDADGYFWRMTIFIRDSKSYDEINPDLAYRAGIAFGDFQLMLSDLPGDPLHETIPDFHNMEFRLEEFRQAVNRDRVGRVMEVDDLIKEIESRAYEMCLPERLHREGKLPKRINHCDTKVNNILFDNDGQVLCVVDLDTVMPGYFISDVGDMMRTYLCPVSEEEKDFSKITIRSAFYDAIVNGYLSEMGAVLSEQELTYFHFAGKFMIYMQAIRFLTDHINDDIYYGAKYDGHNFVRAGNQLTLLQRLIEFNPG